MSFILFLIQLRSTKSSDVFICQFLLATFALSCPAGLPEDDPPDPVHTVPPNYFGHDKVLPPAGFEHQGKSPEFTITALS